MFGRSALAALAALVFLGLCNPLQAATCYDPTWDYAHAARVRFADGSEFAMEVRGARDNSTDASLLLVKGSAPDYLCVPIGPRVRNVQYPFQGVTTIEAVALAKQRVIAIVGHYGGGADCCQLLQFLRVSPKSGAVGFNTHGGFALPQLARYRHGVNEHGVLIVLLATRVLGADGNLAGPHPYRFARYEYDAASTNFVKVAEWSSRRSYDLSSAATDVFAAEGVAIDGAAPSGASR